MASPIKIYEGRDFYVPEFKIKIGRSDLPKEVVRDIIQVTFKDSLDNIESFEFTVNNWDAATRTFKYSGSDIFIPGNGVELTMGYMGDAGLSPMIEGEITSMRPTFPAGGQPTLAVSGVGPLHKLRRKQESHTYEDRTDGEIARQIAGRLGVTITTDADAEAAEERFAYLIQDNKLDIVFLLERAKRLGYDLYIEAGSGGKSIYFGPTVNKRQPEFELHYGKSLIQFQPNLDVSNQVYKVTVKGWDAINKTHFEQTVSRGEIRVKGINCPTLQAALEESFKEKEETVSDAPVNSPQEAITLAREYLEENAKQMVKASGSTVGLPELRSGTVLHIGGLDDCFNGRYFVTGTTHTIGGSGYTTQFQCRLEEL